MVPAGQAWQELCPGLVATVLAGHGWQADTDVAPVVDRKVPAGQGTLLLLLPLLPGQYCPVGQGMAAPVGEGQ